MKTSNQHADSDGICQAPSGLYGYQVFFKREVLQWCQVVPILGRLSPFQGEYASSVGVTNGACLTGDHPSSTCDLCLNQPFWKKYAQSSNWIISLGREITYKISWNHHLVDVSNSCFPSYQIPSAPPWPWNEGRLHEDLLSERQGQRLQREPFEEIEKNHVFTRVSDRNSKHGFKDSTLKKQNWCNFGMFWGSSYIFDVSFNVSFHFWIVPSFPFSPPFQVPSPQKVERFPKPPHRQIRWILLGLAPRYVSAWSFIAQEDGGTKLVNKKNFGQGWVAYPTIYKGRGYKHVLLKMGMVNKKTNSKPSFHLHDSNMEESLQQLFPIYSSHFTIWKIHHECRCISCWTWGFSS